MGRGERKGGREVGREDGRDSLHFMIWGEGREGKGGGQ